jgi:ParB-like chromosome segregation protein Spo0J
MENKASEFPLLEIAKEMEDSNQFEGAKEVYMMCIDEAGVQAKWKELFEEECLPEVTSKVVELAKQSIERIEAKQRENAKQFMPASVVKMPVNKLKPMESVATIIPPIDRRDYEKLLKSIKEQDIQVPLVVNKRTNEIICGVNRWRAAKEVGLKEVPCWLVTLPNVPSQIIYAIDDNLCRRHLSDKERVHLAAERVRIMGKPQRGRPSKNDKRVSIRQSAKLARVPESTVRLHLSKLSSEKMRSSTLPEPSQKAFYVEKINKKFNEVNGLEWKELYKDMVTTLEATMSGLNLGKDDRIRAVVTMFVRRKEE